MAMTRASSDGENVFAVSRVLSAGLRRPFGGPVVVRKNSIRASCGCLFQPVLAVQAAENGFAPNKLTCR